MIENVINPFTDILNNMQIQGKSSAVVSITLVIILLLPAVNLTATDSDQNPIPQLEPIENAVSGFPPGWSEDVRQTYAPDYSRSPDIAFEGDFIYIVWKDKRSGSYEVYFKKSEDSGLIWSEDVKISTVSPSPFCEPRIAVSGSHTHVVWEGVDFTREVHYRNSTDYGETWNDEVRLTEDDGEMSYLPCISVSGNCVHVMWTDERNSGNPNIYYRNSTTGGLDWNAVQRLTNYPNPEAGVDIGVNVSNIHITWARWLTQNEVFYMSSSDGGTTWNLEHQLTPDNGIGTDPHSIAVWQDHVHLVYEEQSEVYYINSTDGGTSWNPSRRISDLPGSSINPDICADDEKVHIIWQDQRDNNPYPGAWEIYYATSYNNGTDWSGNTRLTNSTVGSRGYQIVGADNDNVHVLWSDNRSSGIINETELFYKRSPDFPDLSPPSHTNETPLPDSYKDAPGTNVSVHVTDPSGVNESTIQLYVNGSLVSHTLTPITDGFNVSYISPGFDPGVIECRIVADDNCSNTLDYTWNFTVLALYEIQLHEGWNLISVPHVQVDIAIDEVLIDIDGKWDYIQWYDASDLVDKWKTNATFKPQQLNDLLFLNRSMAFWINITELDVNLTVRGHISTYTEIQLYAGWNLVGYPTQTTETVANALWGTGADRVEVYNATEPYQIKEVGATYVMKPGEGYWVHVPANSVWVVDW
ncbi:MAG: exo-alpha-sialidase [Thermoplasmata archaeon]|nr:exo-alpha-sialidase [Thermoplasmata archaeon]